MITFSKILCSLGVLLLVACQTSTTDPAPAEERSGTLPSAEARERAAGETGGEANRTAALVEDTGEVTIAACTGQPGGSSFCDESCPCDSEQGDCDSDAECVDDLRCFANVGAHFGFEAGVDLCLPMCSPYGVGDWSYCSDDCLCEAGQGDCDSDTDCAIGYRCLHDTGAAYGLDPELDTCEAMCSSVGLGTRTFCSPDCPCDVGEGDCDSSADCAPGLACVDNAGAQYGLSPDTDVCQGTATCDAADGAGDDADAARLLAFTYQHSWQASVYLDDAFLCGGEDDWYRFPASSAGFTTLFFAVRAEARGADHCGPRCENLVLPDAPENSITIEVFDETQTILFASQSDLDGTLRFDVRLDDVEYTGDFLIHVTGAAEATYPYTLHLWAQPEDGEDECEC